MTPQMRNELARIKQAIDQEIEGMRGRGDGGGNRPSWMGRRAAPAELPEATGFSVPVELEVKDREGYGKVTVYLSFPPEAFNDAEDIIAGLIAEGVPVKVWKQKPAYDGNGGGRRDGYGDRDRGGYGGGRGFDRDRGGYGRRD